uniref:Uncharacterized protein n=1 Tax=Cyprinus carpio TaxID=7962 RepID=A0A8C2FSS8_CYPCA
VPLLTIINNKLYFYFSFNLSNFGTLNFNKFFFSPLYSFEDNSDYVYDVMWSPTHPALFACVDGVGHLDLWNLNNETEVPTASVTVEGSPALNRVRWAQSGREVAVGDSEGQVHIYDVGEQISVPRQDEWTRFVLTLTEINENREDVEELAAQRLAA